MSTDLIVTDLQKQDMGTDGNLIQLFEIQISDTAWVYLCNEYAVPSAGTKVTFRNKTTPANTNTYQVIPIDIEGIESSSEGPLARPSLTIANVYRTLDNSSFEGAIYVANGNIKLTFEDLLGKKVIRRTTLRKYLKDGSGDSNPPVEYPSDVFFMDRVTEESSQNVSFELVSAFDLEGVTLPRRTISANACSWAYQGAGTHLYEWEKKGGCTWGNESAIYIDGVRHNVYVNKEDEYVVPSYLTFTTFSTSATANGYYKTVGTSSVKRIGADGSIAVTAAANDYWLCRVATSTTPSDTSADWYRVRLYTPYTTDMVLNVYTDSDFNSYALYASSETIKGVSTTVHKLWKASFKSQETTVHVTAPGYNSYWAKGDLCGKTLTSCSLRFGVAVSGVITSTSFSAASDIVTSVAHGVVTGQPITYSSSSTAGVIGGIGGLTTGQTYYVIKITNDTFELATTPANAAAGTNVDLTGEGTGTHRFSISKVTAVANATAIKPYGAFPTARNF